ncbi:MAG TPA: outer membrane lipoprotein carrier protein LolA [Pelovirga sp.]|nr:outer membrane lipoprotein carrier protein LolA [Pelovirga sp.]
MNGFAGIKRIFLVLLVGLALAVPSLAADNDGLQNILAQLKAAAAKVKTLQSLFVQEKNLEMFEQQLLSSGRMVYVQPDQLRWELLTPVASGFILKGEQGVRWNAVSQQRQRFSVNADPLMGVVAQQLLAWARVDLEWLRERYRIVLMATAPVVLELTPLDPGEAEFIESIEVTFDPQQGYVTDVLIQEQSSDSMRLRFTDVRINDSVAAEAFVPPEF